MKKHINNLICSVVGHKENCVLEYRIRKNNGNWWSRKGGKKRVEYRWVFGQYRTCDRCGKRLSNFERL